MVPAAKEHEADYQKRTAEREAGMKDTPLV